MLFYFYAAFLVAAIVTQSSYFPKGTMLKVSQKVGDYIMILFWVEGFADFCFVKTFGLKIT